MKLRHYRHFDFCRNLSILETIKTYVMKSILLILISFAVPGIVFSQAQQELYKQAEELNKQKEYQKALLLINKALRIDSVNLDYYDLKAESLTGLKKFDDAYFTITKAISLYPTKAYLYDRRAQLLATISENDAAIADYTKAMELAENDTMKHYFIVNRATAKIGKRDFNGAYDDLMTAYLFDSSQVATLVNLGSVCDETGRGDQTLGYLLKAIAIDSTLIGAIGNIGFKYQEMGDHKKAIEYFDKILRMDPNEPLGYSNRSFNKLKLNDIKGALIDINKSIQLYPSNSYAYRTRALIYIEQKQFGKACTDIQTSLDKGFTERYGDEVIKLQKKYCDLKNLSKTL